MGTPLTFVFYTATLQDDTRAYAALLDSSGAAVASCEVHDWACVGKRMRGGSITWLHVRADARRQGHATRLIREVATRAVAAGKTVLSLAVHRDNIGARLCYEAAGFRLHHEDESWHWMSLPLTD